MSHSHPELSAPAPLVDGGLRVTPLGGLGDVGRNMTVFEHDGRLLIVDCGVLFPEDHHPGVDLILPDFESIRDRLDAVEALVLTHGHEDHIGATPYLLRERQDIPLVGSELTLALLDGKLREHRLKETVHHMVREGDTLRIGPFELEFVAVNHSIPDALAVAIRAGGQMVLHTGDFKMDQLPLDGRITDLRGVRAAGRGGRRPLPHRLDQRRDPGLHRARRSRSRRSSTRSSATPSRRSWSPASPRTSTASSRSSTPPRRTAARRRTSAARWSATWPSPRSSATSPSRPACSSTPRTSASLPPERQVLISTGSQGEPMSALSRIAQRDHHIVHIEEGDTVLLASSLIPGNENAVYRVINGLARWGARVVHKGNALVHVSGHASAGELLYCYNIVKPRNVMPVHGEIRHLLANGALATATGVDNVVIAEDGIVVDLVDGVAKVAGKVGCGYVFVDGSSVGDITESDLKDRRILGEEGFISVIVVVDSVSGKVAAGPEIHARGFVDIDFDEIRQPIVDALDATIAEGNTDCLPAPADRAPGRRSLGQQQAPPPADDHPGGHRGLGRKVFGHHPSRDRGTSLSVLDTGRSREPRVRTPHL